MSATTETNVLELSKQVLWLTEAVRDLQAEVKELRDCRWCDGRGWVTRDCGRDECPECRGSGRKP